MLTKQVPPPPRYLFYLFNMPGHLVRLMEGSALGQSPQSHWSLPCCSVYPVALLHHSHTAWGKQLSFTQPHHPRSASLYPSPSSLTLSYFPAVSALFSPRWLCCHCHHCAGLPHCRLELLPAQWSPGNTWGDALGGRRGVTSGVFLLEVFKHATIRSGPIFFYAYEHLLR